MTEPLPTHYTATRQQWHTIACDLMQRKLTHSAERIQIALKNVGPYWARPDRPNEPLTIDTTPTTYDAGYLQYECATYYPKYFHFPEPDR